MDKTDAKKKMLKELKKVMMDDMRGDWKDKMAKVTVASDSPEGLKEGLSKAEKILEKRRMMFGEDDEMLDPREILEEMEEDEEMSEEDMEDEDEEGEEYADGGYNPEGFEGYDDKDLDPYRTEGFDNDELADMPDSEKDKKKKKK